MTFYKTFVRCIIDYGSILCANDPNSTLVLLDGVQNQSIVQDSPKALPKPHPFQLSSMSLEFLLSPEKNPAGISIYPSLYQFLIVHNTWKCTKSMPLLSQIIKELYPRTTSVYSTDTYVYMNTPYLDIFHKLPSKFLRQSHHNEPAPQAIHNLIVDQSLFTSILMHLRQMITTLQFSIHHNLLVFKGSLLSRTLCYLPNAQTSPENESPLNESPLCF